MLQVSLDGEIDEVIALGNVVPTGLEVSGNTIYSGQAGPIPHLPGDGKVVAFGPKSSTSTEVASGARLIVDVEFDRGHNLYALSQGIWDGVAEGSPALPDTGSLLEVQSDGSFEPVVDGQGEEIVLDRPTSVEFIGDSAYVVTLAGDVVRIDNVSRPPYGP